MQTRTESHPGPLSRCDRQRFSLRFGAACAHVSPSLLTTVLSAHCLRLGRCLFYSLYSVEWLVPQPPLLGSQYTTGQWQGAERLAGTHLPRKNRKKKKKGNLPLPILCPPAVEAASSALSLTNGHIRTSKPHSYSPAAFKSPLNRVFKNPLLVPVITRLF